MSKQVDIYICKQAVKEMPSRLAFVIVTSTAKNYRNDVPG